MSHTRTGNSTTRRSDQKERWTTSSESATVSKNIQDFENQLAAIWEDTETYLQDVRTDDISHIQTVLEEYKGGREDGHEAVNSLLPHLVQQALGCPPPSSVLILRDDNHSSDSSTTTYLDALRKCYPESSVAVAASFRGGVDEGFFDLLRVSGLQQLYETLTGNRDRKNFIARAMKNRDESENMLVDAIRQDIGLDKLAQISRIFGYQGPVSINTSDSTSGSMVALESENDYISMHWEGSVMKPMESRFVLGKRGRYYREVWEEEDLLEKHKNSPGWRFSMVRDWSELVRNYVDDHDGPYRDWSMEMTQLHRDAIISENKDRKKIGANKSSATTTQSSSLSSSLLSLDTARPILLAPPVPVALQHPASWGVNCRWSPETFRSKYPKSDDSKVFEHIHPACYSKTIVKPPGAQCNRVGIDIDDLTVFADKLERQLIDIEMQNYRKLERLKRYGEISSMRNSVKRRRLELSRALEAMYAANEPSESSRFTFDFHPSNTDSNYLEGDGNVDRTHNNSNENNSLSSPSAVRKASTRSSSQRNRASPASQSKSRRIRMLPMLGACAAEHVSHASFVSQLKKGDSVEYQRDGKWRLGNVTRIHKDRGFVRALKVKPYLASDLEMWWYSVEDSLLAPPGTHLRNTEQLQFDCDSSNAVKIKSDLINDIDENIMDTNDYASNDVTVAADDTSTHVDDTSKLLGSRISAQ